VHYSSILLYCPVKGTSSVKIIQFTVEEYRRIMRNFTRIFLMLSLSVLGFPFIGIPEAYAEITQKDYQTIVRSIGFLQQTPGPEAVFAIVYDPGNSGSVQEAQQMKSFIETQGNKVLTARMVSVTDMARLEGAPFTFITQGLDKYYSQLSSIMPNYKTLSFTQDRSCIEQGCCAVFVNSGNRVEIVVNRNAVEMAQAQFKPAFLMMVTLI
jgi:hypothetical protein